MTAVLQIDGLQKTYHSMRSGHRRAGDGMDMAVEAGQVHGFLGPDGSGKTTTLRALLGLVRTDGGQMRLFGMMNLLLWRPKRLRVLATKLGTALAGVLTICADYLLVWTGAFWLIARYRGQLGELTPGVWQSLALTGARATALALAATAVGFALASIGRHTAMALGVAVG